MKRDVGALLTRLKQLVGEDNDHVIRQAYQIQEVVGTFPPIAPVRDVTRAPRGVNTRLAKALVECETHLNSLKDIECQLLEGECFLTKVMDRLRVDYRPYKGKDCTEAVCSLGGDEAAQPIVMEGGFG